MSNSRTYEDNGKKIRRITNNQFIYARSYDNRTDIPIVRINTSDEIEFDEVPVVKDSGRLALLSEVGNGQYFFRDPKVVSSDNVSSKSFNLSHAPSNPESSFMLVDGGPPQIHGIDFEIVGQTLYWNGLGLEDLMDEGDEVFVFYQI